MSHIIRRHNDANHAQTLTGQWVSREKEIRLESHHQSYPLLHTSLHFCFKDPSEEGNHASTIFCTCGSPAAVFTYGAYRRFQSKNEGEVIACIEFIQQGVHADGSHE